MSPITHLMVGWVGLERIQPTARDKALVVLAGLAPDVDGLGIIVDFATRVLGLPETDYYQAFHRLYGHGLPAALVIAALAGALGTRRRAVAAWAFVSVHLHFLCDLIGSRGNAAEDIWGIYYFAPITRAYAISWSGQWPLVGWQNTAISAVLLAIMMMNAATSGYSPVGWLSERADAAFVATLRGWKGRMLSVVRGGGDKGG
jgi:inner membrane protein